MTRTARNILIACGVFCFVAAATQAMSLLHHAEHKHGQGHNEATCQICIAASAIQKQVLVEPEPQLQDLQISIADAPHPPNNAAAQFTPRIHRPRAPPSLS